jgi:O-methyltransferase involved in polyketide biosynthesis
MYGARDAYQRLAVKQGRWKFGMTPEDVANVLAEYGWRETQQLGPAEYRDRDLAPTGRGLAVSEIERAVSAERVGPSIHTPGPGRVAKCGCSEWRRG